MSRSNKYFYRIHNFFHKNFFLSLKFVFYQVWQGDGLPEKMCNRCVTRAESALLYREQCRAADRALRQALLKVIIYVYVSLSFKKKFLFLKYKYILNICRFLV